MPAVLRFAIGAANSLNHGQRFVASGRLQSVKLRLMHPLLVVGAVILIIFIFRALYFHLRFAFLRKVEGRHHTYATKKAKPSYSDPNDRWLEEHSLTVKKYVLEAGLDEPVEKMMQPVGFGYAQPVTFRVMDNWLVLKEGLADRAHIMLIRAKGFYRDQRNQNLNPLHWGELLVFLPKQMLEFLGVGQPWLMNITQLVYWVGMLSLAVYQALKLK